MPTKKTKTKSKKSSRRTPTGTLFTALAAQPEDRLDGSVRFSDDIRASLHPILDAERLSEGSHNFRKRVVYSVDGGESWNTSCRVERDVRGESVEDMDIDTALRYLQGEDFVWVESEYDHKLVGDLTDEQLLTIDHDDRADDETLSEWSRKAVTKEIKRRGLTPRKVVSETLKEAVENLDQILSDIRNYGRRGEVQEFIERAQAIFKKTSRKTRR